MRAATLCIGYGDGYSRNLSRTNGAFNLARAMLHSGGGFTRAWADFGGFRAPLCGIVSMSNTTFDVSGVPEGALAKCRFAQVIGPAVPFASFRSAIGYSPAEIAINLARPNPNALDLSAEEFAKTRIAKIRA